MENYDSLARRAARLVDRRPFVLLVAGLIIANSISLGLQTYPGIVSAAGSSLKRLDSVFLWIFVGELLVRLVAYGRSPQRFLKNGWNLFDTLVIGAAFVPTFGAGATVLRIVRVLRVARIISVLPELRVVLRGMVRATIPIGAVGFLMLIIFYAYAMVGWALFRKENPDEWGNVGESMLTLFEVLTLEDWVDILDRGMAIHPWSWVFFISFVLLTAFVVINIVIAVIITSVEDARRDDPTILGSVGARGAQQQEVAQRIVELRQALDDLEKAAAPRRVQGLIGRE